MQGTFVYPEGTFLYEVHLARALAHMIYAEGFPNELRPQGGSLCVDVVYISTSSR